MKFTAFCDLRADFANLFGHLSQIRRQVLLLQTCVDLHRLASPFGQGLKAIVIHDVIYVIQVMMKHTCCEFLFL